MINNNLNRDWQRHSGFDDKIMSCTPRGSAEMDRRGYELTENAPAWVWFTDEEGVPISLPKTASGKVQKHVLREWTKDLVEQDVGRVKE